jgi:hypothetical protein
MTSSKFLSVKTFIVPFAAAAGLMLVASADSSLAGGQRACNTACQNKVLGKAFEMKNQFEMKAQPSADGQVSNQVSNQVLNIAPTNNG